MFLQKNFNYLKKSSEVSFRDIQKDTGINTRTLGILAHENELNIRIEVVNKLAKYFVISIDELVNTDLSNEKPIDSESTSEGDV